MRRSLKSPSDSCPGALRSADLIVRSIRRMRLRAVALRLAFAAYVLTSPARAENPAEVFELPRVEVIGTTPLPGLGTALSDGPANVQAVGDHEHGRNAAPRP